MGMHRFPMQSEVRPALASSNRADTHPIGGSEVQPSPEVQQRKQRKGDNRKIARPSGSGLAGTEALKSLCRRRSDADHGEGDEQDIRPGPDRAASVFVDAGPTAMRKIARK